MSNLIDSASFSRSPECDHPIVSETLSSSSSSVQEDVVAPYRRWHPADGAVFADASHIAMDCETLLIDHNNPRLIPPLVVAAASDGQNSVFVMPEDVEPFLQCHRSVTLVFHNAAFDIPVLQNYLNTLDLFEWVDQGRVRDTMILHRLLHLAYHGDVPSKKGASTLDACARSYLGEELSKQVTDSEGHDVRTGFGRFFKRPFEEIPHDYLEYLARDAQVTARIYAAMKKKVTQWFECWAQNPPLGIPKMWGKGTPGLMGRIAGRKYETVTQFLREQFERWGPFSHNIQLKAALMLDQITRNGLHVDTEKAKVLVDNLRQQKQQLADRIIAQGLRPEGKDSQTQLQHRIATLHSRHPHLPIPRTSSKQYAATDEVLRKLARLDPVLGLLAEYRTVSKQLSGFAEKLNKPVLHPRYQTLVKTGRTSSFGDINAQNLPRDSEFRELIIPSAGQVFLKVDYRMIELCALAEAVISQVGIESEMGRRINAGIDLHRFTAAQLLNKPVEQVTEDERSRAKAVSFGKPGALGDSALQEYARQSYGVEMTEAEARQLSQRWMQTYPEMEVFLKSGVNGGVAAARMLSLTPNDHHRQTGDGRLLEIEAHVQYPDGPSGILGTMFLRTMADEEPCTDAGKPYRQHDLDYFWKRAEQFVACHGNQLPEEMVQRIRLRQPNPRLAEAFEEAAMRVCVITLTGRVRNWASFAASRNTLFQGLAADGAKEAMWKLSRAGYRIVAFVHDEFLIQIPEDSDLAAHVKTVEKLMIEGMKRVLPNVRVEVESKLLRSWSTKDEIQLPATTPGSISGSALGPEVAVGCQTDSTDSESGGNFAAGSANPKSGWGFGHPGRTDSATPNPFHDFLNDDGEEDGPPVF